MDFGFCADGLWKDRDRTAVRMSHKIDNAPDRGSKERKHESLSKSHHDLRPYFDSQPVSPR